MAITKSAKKAMRQSLKRKGRNLAYKTKLKKAVKELKTLITQKKQAEAVKFLPTVYSALDKAAKAGVIKKNNASRHKSRLTKFAEKKTA